MAVIISDANNTSYDGNLSTTDGWYRVEAYNLGNTYTSGASVALTTGRSIPVTFANAGNLQGFFCCMLVGAISGNTTYFCDRDLTVTFDQIKGSCTISVASPGVITYTSHGLSANDPITFSTTGALPTGLSPETVYYVKTVLTGNTFTVSATAGGTVIDTSGTQSGTHTLWRSLQVKTLTSAEVTAEGTNTTGEGWIVPFKFDSYTAVDTTGSKWRFTIKQYGGTNQTWSLIVSSTTGYPPIFGAWCDNKVTATNNDALCIMDTIYVDSDFTAKGTLGTGSTESAWAIVTLRNTDPTVANVCKLRWERFPTTAHTLTVDGKIIFSGASGMQVGSPDTSTSTVTLSIASPCVVTWNSHGLSANQPIKLTTTGALPTGLSVNTTYFVKSVDANTFNLSETPSGTNIDTTGSQSGTHTATANERISIAARGTLYCQNPTIGSTNGISTCRGQQAQTRTSIRVYGEVPKVQTAILADNLPAGGTVTISIASPCVITRTSHGVHENCAVSFYTTGALPTGITANAVYYAKNVTSSTFEISDTPGGASIDTSGTQSGTQTLNPVIVTTVPTGWTVGDLVLPGGWTGRGSAGYTTRRTIAAIDGVNIVPNILVADSALLGHPVLNMSQEYGFHIKGNDTLRPGFGFSGAANIVISGCKFTDTSGFTLGLSSTRLGYWSNSLAANRSAWVFEDCMIYNTVGNSTRFILGNYFSSPPEGVTVQRINGGIGGGLIQNSNWGWIPNGAGRSGPVLIKDNITLYCAVAQFMANGSNPLVEATIDNNIFEYHGASGSVFLQGRGLIVTNNRFFNSSTTQTVGGLNFYGLIGCYFSGNHYDLLRYAKYFQQGVTLNNIVLNEVYGGEAANTYDYYITEGILFGMDESAPNNETVIDTTNLSGCVTGSRLKIQQYNNTPELTYSWHPEGIFVSDPANDTIIGQTIDAALTLTNRYKMTTGDVSGITIAAIVDCKISSATYYAGTYVLPKLIATYDVSSTDTATASASTSEQELFVVFTPTTDYNNVYLDLTQKTDATGADAKVTWDTLVVRMRKYGKTFYSFTKMIQEVDTDSIANLAALADNSFVTEGNPSTVGAYTGITINHATQTVTIDEAHSVNELYDYSQYDLSLEANMDKSDWFTTIDGTTYSCSYDIVVDGVVLSGSGKVISMPSNSFSATNGGSTSAQITDENGTLTSLTLTGLVAGSEVRMYKESDSSEYSGGTESCSTTHAFNFQHTGDVAVFIVVLNLGYEPMRISGITLTADPQSIPVSQRIDRVYSNPA